MSANWTPQFITALAFAAALGNALAIGVHVFSWWLRKRALVFMATFGGFAMLFYLLALLFFSFLFSGGFAFDASEPEYSDWPLHMAFYFLLALLVSSAVVSLIGAQHKREMKSNWLDACLCFCFELALSAFVGFLCASLLDELWIANVINRYEAAALLETFAIVFIFSIFALAFFRPFFLTVLKYIFHFIKPNSSDAKQIS